MNICQLLNIAKQDESDAPILYEKIKNAVDRRDKHLINKIIQDEKRHQEDIKEIMSHTSCR